jgi:hypothetical protein
MKWIENGRKRRKRVRKRRKRWEWYKKRINHRVNGMSVAVCGNSG